MRRPNACFWLVLFMAGSVFGIPLHCAPIAWQLVEVTFSDGATATGIFTYDAAG